MSAKDDRAQAELAFVVARERLRHAHYTERCCGISSDALALYGLGQDERPDDFPGDEDDLRACERTYEMAPPWVQERMLPVLEEFRRYVRQHRNRYGEAIGRRDASSVRAGGPCALCGRDPAAGYASVIEGDVESWLCHDLPPDGKRSCYVQWTVYGVRVAP